MTPTTRSRLIRSCLQVLLQGEGAIEDRLEAIAGALSKLPLSQRTPLLKELRPRLVRAIHSRSAQIRSATPLPDELIAKLKALAHQRGALTVSTHHHPELLAGYCLQIGDDRTDYSLKARLQQFI
jgi:hypothetical protein